jgi:hypothetical protein
MIPEAKGRNLLQTLLFALKKDVRASKYADWKKELKRSSAIYA